MILKLEIKFRRATDAPPKAEGGQQWAWEATAGEPFTASDGKPLRIGRGDNMSQALADLLRAIAQEMNQS